MDSTAWDERYRTADRLWGAEPNLFVEDRLGPLEPGTGLDFAAGDGRHSIWLRERGWTMTAVDFSEVAVRRGREISSEVEFVVGDVMAWEPDRTFSLVLIAYLQLLEDQMEKIVKRATRWLQPGGELFMIGHDVSNLENGYGGPRVPEVLWEVGKIKSWLEDLTIIEAQVVRRPVETEAGVVFARDALIRARND